MYVPSGLPGARPIALNCSVMYATELSSPAVPGPRPSKPSEARRLMCWRMFSLVMAVIAGSSAADAAEAAAVSRVACSPRELHAAMARRAKQATRRSADAFTFTPNGWWWSGNYSWGQSAGSESGVRVRTLTPDSDPARHD